MPKEFPNEAPVMYSMIAVDHPVVNKNDMVIKFTQFYPWEKKSSKIVELISSAEKYFTANSPFDNSASKKVESLFSKLEDNCLKGFETMDINSFYNSLSADDKATINKRDEFTTYEILKKSPQYKQVEDTRNLLGKCVNILSGNPFALQSNCH